MIELVKEITKQFKVVTKESYYSTNANKKTTYPYLTYSLDTEALENAEEGYVDVDIFDMSTSYAKLFKLEHELKKHFNKQVELTDNFFIRFEFIRSNEIRTDDDLLIRRNLQFMCRVYWRDK